MKKKIHTNKKLDVNKNFIICLMAVKKNYFFHKLSYTKIVNFIMIYQKQIFVDIKNDKD